MKSFFKNRDLTLDKVTKTFNKTDVYEYAQFLVAEKQPYSLIMFDIDSFKLICDSYGKKAGDTILLRVAQELKNKTGESGSVCRIEADKFLVILKSVTSYDELWSFCHSLHVNINEIDFSEFSGLNVTTTMGIARYPENANTFEDLEVACEKALFRGKTKGRNCFVIYVPEKHGSIEISSHDQRAIGSTNLHASIYKFFETENIKSGIENLLNFLSSYFCIDHICIQKNESIFFQKNHNTVLNLKFEPIPERIFREVINNSTGIFSLSDTQTLLQKKQLDLFESLSRQNINATCLIDMVFQGKSFGILRADMAGVNKNGRAWADAELDVLLTAAKTMAIIFHYSGTDIAKM